MCYIGLCGGYLFRTLFHQTALSAADSTVRDHEWILEPYSKHINTCFSTIYTKYPIPQSKNYRHNNPYHKKQMTCTFIYILQTNISQALNEKFINFLLKYNILTLLTFEHYLRSISYECNRYFKLGRVYSGGSLREYKSFMI